MLLKESIIKKQNVRNEEDQNNNNNNNVGILIMLNYFFCYIWHKKQHILKIMFIGDNFLSNAKI